MARHMLRAVGGFILGVLLFAAPASAGTRVYVRVAPPAPIVEEQTVPPHRGYVWRSGYYRWHGHRYVWTRGRWVRPPYVHAVWNSGVWTHERHGWHWVPGHWARG